MPLGLFPAPVPYRSFEITIDPGCLIFMHTNGLTDGDTAEPIGTPRAAGFRVG
ncbi:MULTISPECIES: hypothetical protein [unclassified Streptomyces]|uniref:hypothetical protein n=1 Tax=unclassified Streptomyces TaxID=2593676 RepID=UPI003D8F7075